MNNPLLMLSKIVADNVEFDWDPDHLSYQPPVEGPPIPVTIDMGEGRQSTGPIRHSGDDMSSW